MKIKTFQIEYLVREPYTCSRRNRYSHKALTRKLPKGVIAFELDIPRRRIELEYSHGSKYQFDLNIFFGESICEADLIRIKYPDGNYEGIVISGIEIFKVKRTLWWKLIFESDLPF